MNAVFLRKATADDADLLFAWANDLDVRRNAFEQHEIMWEEHVQWLRGRLENENCYIYIAYTKTTEMPDLGWETGRPIGQIRLDVEDGTAQIDYCVTAGLRGRGYGSAMLRQAENDADADIRKFAARVKKSNPASLRVFLKCGFAVTADRGSYLELEKERDNRPEREKPSIVICTQKSWNVEYAERFGREYGSRCDVTVITEKEQLTPETLAALRPEYVFFPHWSYLIPEAVFGKYTCIVFHMTDLPYGRGGSPLQNLIVRGHTHTKLSAIRVDRGLDTGDVYMKEELSLAGTADEILRRASAIIFTKMIPFLLEHNPAPVPQSGEAVVFRRRKPEDGRLRPDMDAGTIYDYIRMLDGEGYPNAFLELGAYRLRFSGASYEDGKVKAQVIFEEKG